MQEDILYPEEYLGKEMAGYWFVSLKSPYVGSKSPVIGCSDLDPFSHYERDPTAGQNGRPRQQVSNKI
jgi:hypothetical protein